ncbi:hypothetical protein WJX72_003099 [[Myrmecia] bisecta]|uniref:Phosphatidic acid phosphatase type 2/haloperoxidase domain-containing protein n=1 Tax=[Myrmecia] bisecta TaxID=41462 RepID=A0AAW1QPU1_9CHLO
MISLLASASVWCIVVLCCIPPLHEPLRALLRPKVVKWVEQTLPAVLRAQQYQTHWLTTAFTWSSYSVSVPFYVTFLPTLIWVAEPQLGYRATLLMGLCLYVGNGLKDLLCGPRPLAVSKQAKLLAGSSLEVQTNAQEYGLPSSHTMNSLCLNYYIAHYLVQHGYLPGGTATIILYVLVGVWVVWIGISRVYLGLHTPVDIVAGALAGAMVLTAYLSLDGRYDTWIRTNSFATLVQGLGSVVLLRLHPKPLQHTPSYEFTASFAGVCFGVVAGVNHSSLAGRQYFAQSYALDMLASKQGLLHLLRRSCVGFFLVAAMKEFSKCMLLRSLPAVYRCVPVSLRLLWQPPVHSLHPGDPSCKGMPINAKGQPWDVDITARFISYASIGWSVTELTFLVCDALQW